MNCEKCDANATIHITEIRRGLSYERHLCEKCAEILLPMEESDYAEYLDVLPPRFSADAGEEPLPTDDELEMTGLREEVVVLDLESGEVSEVGPHGGNTSVPVWSPDSKRLAMCHYVETLHSIVLVEPGRPWQRRFLRTTFAEPPTWSCDGRRIAFSHPEESGSCILTAEVTEGTIRHIEQLPCLSESNPVCSPVDDRIAFVGLAIEGDTSWCCVSTATTEPDTKRRLLTLDASFVLHLGWSSDARCLAALASHLGLHEMDHPWGVPVSQTLHVVPADAIDAADTALPGNVMSFAWVPRAAGFGEAPVILAAVLSRHQFTSSAALVDPQTRTPRTVAEDIFFPSREVRSDHLSSDGRTLLVLTGADNVQIACVDVESGETRKIEPRGEVTALAWLVDGEEFIALIRTGRGSRVEAISPDGPRRELAVFEREQFFDVPGMVLSPDGRLAALEVHVTRKD